MSTAASGLLRGCPDFIRPRVRVVHMFRECDSSGRTLCSIITILFAQRKSEVMLHSNGTSATSSTRLERGRGTAIFDRGTLGVGARGRGFCRLHVDSGSIAHLGPGVNGPLYVSLPGIGRTGVCACAGPHANVRCVCSARGGVTFSRCASSLSKS